MRQTITINTPRDLLQFKREFAHLVDVVKQADGKYVLYVDIDRGFGAQPSIISKADFDRVVSPAMHRTPAAFSDRVSGGRFLPDKLNEAYGAFARETQQRNILQNGQRKILNRREYLAYYYGSFDFYPAPASAANASV
jgi:hypothetical protein